MQFINTSFMLDKSFVLDSKGPEPTELDIRAFKQWIKDGTMPEEYVRKVLGDSMESVCAFKPGPNDRNCLGCGSSLEDGEHEGRRSGLCRMCWENEGT